MCNKMSDVRLSNASPTLERVDARHPDNVRPPVRRNLFGSRSPDREEIRRYLAAAMQEDVRDFMEEYNFDPVNDRPLTPRNYEWQEDSDAAEFYYRPPHGSQRDADPHGDNNRPGAEGSSEGQADRQPQRDGSRKRAPGDLPSLIKAVTQFCCAVPRVCVVPPCRNAGARRNSCARGSTAGYDRSITLQADRSVLENASEEGAN